MTGAPTLEALARAHPEWRPWLALYQDVGEALEDLTWIAVTPAPATAGDGAPLLTGAAIALDVRRAASFVARLLTTAAAASGSAWMVHPDRLRDDTAVALFDAALAEDAARIRTLAGALGAETDALAAVMALVAMPLLHAGRRATAASPSWSHGYCPICGAWPTLAEARGVERTRHFRCARCGGEWRADWLRCPYCGNTDHRHLGALVGDDAGTTRMVETCEPCRGYVKTLTVLRGAPPAEVALIDLASIDLDVAALEHGYRRPAGPARALASQVVRAS